MVTVFVVGGAREEIRKSSVRGGGLGLGRPHKLARRMTCSDTKPLQTGVGTDDCIGTDC